MTTTPPLRNITRTPPTPLHGAKYDSYQPYIPRRTTRSVTQRAARTPSPGHATRSSQSKRLVSSNNPFAVRSVVHTYSPPSSTQTSPQNNFDDAKPIMETRISEPLDMESGTKLDPSQASSSKAQASYRTSTQLTNMLPTPAKTPRKKAVQAGLSSTARILFPNRPDNAEEAMPTPRKNARKVRRHIEFSLESFGEDGGAASEEKIEIFTDSKEKVPELDESEDNPFYVKPGQEPVTTVRSSKRRKVSGNAINSNDLEDPKREDGMVYVFRGKKMFRKFPSEHSFDQDSTPTPTLSNPFFASEPSTATSTSPRLRPFTRSSIKPRLLFPTEAQRLAREPGAPSLADEEAVTDIEEAPTQDSEMTEEEPLLTPVKPVFAPVSPPTTGRVTRASKKKEIERDADQFVSGPVGIPNPFGVKKGGRLSPFDGWERTKPGLGKGKKREGETLEKVGEGSKRVKGNDMQL